MIIKKFHRLIIRWSCQNLILDRNRLGLEIERQITPVIAASSPWGGRGYYGCNLSFDFQTESITVKDQILTTPSDN